MKFELPVMIVEDNSLIANHLSATLFERNIEAHICNEYEEALRQISGDLQISACILDLDLGVDLKSVNFGEPGRRLLSLLHSRKVPTLVYSGLTDKAGTLRALNPNVVVLSKAHPVEQAISSLIDLIATWQVDSGPDAPDLSTPLNSRL